MVLLAVNFHYLAPVAPAAPRAVFPITPEALAAQVERLGETFDFVSRDALLAAVEDGAPLPERACALTFDDGLRSHHELALPVLERLGVPATFFVSGRPLAERRALHVHRVHHLRERLAPAEFGGLLDAHLGDAPVRPFTDEDARCMYRYDDPAAARMKYLLNVALEREAGERVVEAMFAAAGPGEAAFVDELYMSRAQVAELEHGHHAVGAHGHDHHPFAALEPAAKVADMERGAAALRAVTGRAPRMISYPYGSAAAVTPTVARAAQRLGFTAGFTMERALNRGLREPLLLGRVDTNDAPGGKLPLLDTEGGEPVALEGMGAARSRYFEEEQVPARA